MKTSKPLSPRLSTPLLLALMVYAGSLYSDNIPFTDDNYSIQGWQVDDGLPRNTITSITQSPDGFIWLGSPFSLIRFDGIEFKEYGLEAGNQIEKLRFITCDEFGQIYLAPRNQLLQKFNKGQFNHLSIAEGSKFDFHCVTTGPDNTIWAIDGEAVIYQVVGQELHRMVRLEADFQLDILFDLDVAQDGTIWFSRGAFYGYYKPGKDPVIWESEDSNFIRLSLANDGTVWMLTQNDLRQLTSDQSGASKHVVSTPEKGGWGQILEVDSRDRVWIGESNSGLYMWENNKLTQFESILGRFRSIFEDRDGSIWIGLEGSGLYRIQDKVFQISSNSGNLIEAYTSSVYQNYFISALPGLFQLTQEGITRPIEEASNLFLSTVWAESETSIWAGGKSGRLYHFNNGNFQKYRIDSNNQPIRLIFQDSKGTLWAGGIEWGLSKLPYPYVSIERILTEPDHRELINALVELPTGQIFAGSRSGNIFCLDEQDIRMYGRESGLKGASILSLYYTSTKRLLAGTSGNGLAILKDGQWHLIGTEQGLFDMAVAQMVEDDFGYLWIGSTRGIFRIKLSDFEEWLDDPENTVRSIVYGKEHGLSNVEAVTDYQPGASRTADGIIQFATNKGLVSVNPEDIGFAHNQPDVIIESIQIDDTSFPANQPVETQSGFQRMSISYTAPSFIAPESIQFRCSLEGFDSDWVYQGKERAIRYTRLPPGDYSFKVMASNQEGTWTNKIATIPITVIPRWWETSLAKTAYLIFLIMTIWIFMRMILIRRMQITLEKARQETLLEREKARIAKDLHDDLGARLTEIAFMADLAPREGSHSNKPERAWKAIAQRARQAVGSLDESVWMLDPGKDNLQQFVPFVVQYTSDFCDRLDFPCRLDIPEWLPSIRLEGRTRHHLLMVYKEALNNAVRHSEGTSVKINISYESKMLRISISDNGKGMTLEQEEFKQRNGITNMRDRMEQLGGTFKLQSEPNHGTTVTFTLELKKE